MAGRPTGKAGMLQSPTRPLAVLLAAALSAGFMAAAVLAGSLPAASQAEDDPEFASRSGLDLTAIDRATAPGRDFYRHVVGTWFDRATLPPDRATTGVDRVMTDRIEARTRRILEGDAAGIEEAARADAAKVAAFYRAFLDEGRADALDVAPIGGQLERIRAATSRESLVVRPSETDGRLGMNLFSLGIYPDSKAPERYALHVGQSGIGLPDRDYYLKPSLAGTRAAYEAYLAELLGLIGWSDPAGAAASILAFETDIADQSWTAADRLDPERTYGPADVGELERTTGFPFRRLLAQAGFGAQDRVILLEASAVPPLAARFAHAPLETLKAWQAVHLADAYAPYLSARFVDAHFRFRLQHLDGVDAISPRWKRAVAAVDTAMGEAVGRVYVAKHVPAGLRDEIDAMVGRLREALRARLERNDWMSPETRRTALEKLAVLGTKLGWPATWRDYTGLRIAPDDLVGNVERGVVFEWRRQVERFGRPVVRSEWTSPPHTVNAFYDWSLNDVTLPVGQIQVPAYGLNADPAVNYGAIGSLLGHELIHGYDNSGRKFDGAGRLRNWWTEADAAQFEARAAALGRQYDAVQVFPGAFVDGALTMGENIADLGGALVALDAYRLSLEGREDPVVDGYTGTQRFFLGFAQSWRIKASEEWVRRGLVSDPHAPAAVRVNGVVRNMDAWYEAFGIGPGDPMFIPPEARVRLW